MGQSQSTQEPQRLSGRQQQSDQPVQTQRQEKLAVVTKAISKLFHVFLLIHTIFVPIILLENWSNDCITYYNPLVIYVALTSIFILINNYKTSATQEAKVTFNNLTSGMVLIMVVWSFVIAIVGKNCASTPVTHLIAAYNIAVFISIGLFVCAFAYIFFTDRPHTEPTRG
jgi:hypothetical protein